MPKVKVPAKSSKSTKHKAAKAPAKKAVKRSTKPATKTRIKKSNQEPQELQALESLIDEMGEESADDSGLCGDSDDSGFLGAEQTGDQEPVIIITEETVIGDEPGESVSEILAGADSDEGDDEDEDEDFDDELDEELDSDDDEDEDDGCNE